MDNISDKVKVALGNWFDEASELFDNEIKIYKETSETPSFEQFEICLPSLPMTRNYSEAAMLLLREGHLLPASALVRILCEFVLKVMWCTYKAKDCKEELKRRRNQWCKSTLKSQIRLWQKGVELGKKINTDVDFEEKLKNIMNIFDSLNCRHMPNIADICEELSLYYEDITFAVIYVDLCSSIHPDLSIITNSMVFEKGNVITFSGDDTRKSVIPHLFLLILRLNYYFFLALYDCFGWNFMEIKKEYRRLSPEVCAWATDTYGKESNNRTRPKNKTRDSHLS